MPFAAAQVDLSILVPLRLGHCPTLLPLEVQTRPGLRLRLKLANKYAMS